MTKILSKITKGIFLLKISHQLEPIVRKFVMEEWLSWQATPSITKFLSSKPISPIFLALIILNFFFDRSNLTSKAHPSGLPANLAFPAKLANLTFWANLANQPIWTSQPIWPIQPIPSTQPIWHLIWHLYKSWFWSWFDHFISFYFMKYTIYL